MRCCVLPLGVSVKLKLDLCRVVKCVLRLTTMIVYQTIKKMVLYSIKKMSPNILFNYKTTNSDTQQQTDQKKKRTQADAAP